jgi:GT2 family glycosyltransferase
MTREDDDTLPFVSVVIPAEHAEGRLARCLASVSHITYPRERYEVLVVGDATRETADVVQRYGARHVFESKKGVGYARNAGIDASRGQIVAFTDSDCAVSTGWLCELVKPFAHETVGAVAGAIVPYPPATEPERYAARRVSHSQIRPLGDPARPFALTPNLAFRRRALSEVGMFDTAFRGGGWEDADLCWRLARSSSFSLDYAPRAVVFHHYRSTARAFLAQHYRYGYGLGLLVCKYRHELPESWLRGPAQQDGLGSLAWLWVYTTVLRHFGRSADPTRPGFDLLRLLGQRAGFLHATMIGRRR